MAAAGSDSASPPQRQLWKCVVGPCARQQRSPGAAGDAGLHDDGGGCGEGGDAGAGGGDAGDGQPLPRSHRCKQPSFL